jgi:uncharacterized membrane protein YhaH (DUF805 family)
MLLGPTRVSPPVPPTFSFLFRSDEGRIGRTTWWRGTALLAGPLLLFTIGWAALSPFAHRGLDERGLIDLPTLAAYVYLLLYAFAILLIAVSFYNLCAKRWRDRGRPASLAGLLPFAVLIAGAAHWLVPRSEGQVPISIAIALDLLALAVAAWALIELGCVAGLPEKRI